MEEKTGIHIETIARELNIGIRSVGSAVRLLNDGATVPFIARYRKDATGKLDETQISSIKQRIEQLEELDKRAESIIETLRESEKLTPLLESKLKKASTIRELEDIYQPYRPKRRTRASAAEAKGLKPLAEKIMCGKVVNLLYEAEKFVNPGKELPAVSDVLEGASDIIAERISEDIEAKNRIRVLFKKRGILSSAVKKGKDNTGRKYADYFNWKRPLRDVPAHTILALLRGKRESVLRVSLKPEETDALDILEKHFIKPNTSKEVRDFLKSTVKNSYKRLIMPSIENETLNDAKAAADDKSIVVFAGNLKELLLQPPLGRKNVMGLDPGFSSGVKLVCLDSTGALLHHDVVYPHSKKTVNRVEAEKKVIECCRKYSVEAVAVGNGTAGRETEAFLRKIDIPEDIVVTMVNESGASIYSASECGIKEFPDHDITVRGAVSIGRRLMDPLAELVKIPPKSIGVGQYQHDVDQTKLKKALRFTVESCVNSVGVELNSASAELLEYVSGIGSTAARNIVDYRNKNGKFKSRSELKKVSRLGPAAFEQCAGFIRVSESLNPLDLTAVHPESYKTVRKVASDMNVKIEELIENKTLRENIDISEYCTENIGFNTLNDIISELEKPGRDPRNNFEPFSFAEGINSIDDLSNGMILKGIITNVTNFGAFTDIGVHCDGLIHISEMADRYISDPARVVKVGMRVKVKVVSVDKDKKRIGLSLKH